MYFTEIVKRQILQNYPTTFVHPAAGNSAAFGHMLAASANVPRVHSVMGLQSAYPNHPAAAMVPAASHSHGHHISHHGHHGHHHMPSHHHTGHHSIHHGHPYIALPHHAKGMMLGHKGIFISHILKATLKLYLSMGFMLSALIGTLYLFFGSAVTRVLQMGLHALGTAILHVANYGQHG